MSLGDGIQLEYSIDVVKDIIGVTLSGYIDNKKVVLEDSFDLPKHMKILMLCITKVRSTENPFREAQIRDIWLSINSDTTEENTSEEFPDVLLDIKDGNLEDIE
jgi:hypothetical protein